MSKKPDKFKQHIIDIFRDWSVWQRHRTSILVLAYSQKHATASIHIRKTMTINKDAVQLF